MKKNKKRRLVLIFCWGVAIAGLAAFAGCAGNQYDRSTGQYVDDKSLAMRVHSALSDNPEYKFGDVNVDCFRGTVQLSGFVNTADEKSKAVQIAKGVQGAKDVDNKISVKETQ
jgi:osmotically-inducible protein OsmY